MRIPNLLNKDIHALHIAVVEVMQHLDMLFSGSERPAWWKPGRAGIEIDRVISTEDSVKVVVCFRPVEWPMTGMVTCTFYSSPGRELEPADVDIEGEGKWRAHLFRGIVSKSPINFALWEEGSLDAREVFEAASKRVYGY